VTAAPVLSVALGDRFARELPEMAVAWQAAEVPRPQLLVLDEALAAELGLDADALRSPAGIGLLTGTAVPDGARPVAQAYSGHQFGYYNPRLGDGRALLLGELVDREGRLRDLHLKGSGRTPFSRGGDGLAAVGPMLREYVVGRAMHALGIPTTRALAVVATGRPVQRETVLPGAVLARVAVAALVLTPFALFALRGHWGDLRRSARLILVYGVVAVAGAQLAYFSAVSHLSVGVALLLEYQGVVLVVGWLWLTRGRRPSRLVVTGALVAAAGLALVLDVLGDVRIDGVGVVWGLAAAVGLAAYFVVAGDADAAVPPVVLSCAGLWVGSAALAAAGLAGVVPLRATTASVELSGRSVSWLVPVLWLALVAAAFAYVVGTAAARALGATLASFVGLTEVVFAVLAAWALVGQLPTPVQLVGGVVILVGIALVKLDDLRRTGDVVVAPEPAPVPATVGD